MKIVVGLVAILSALITYLFIIVMATFVISRFDLMSILDSYKQKKLELIHQKSKEHFDEHTKIQRNYKLEKTKNENQNNL
jgi:hypothetical protein